MALNIKTEILANGFKLVLVDLPQYHTVTNFLVIRSGSRYENEQNNGIAHFLEHLVFKGTDKYPGTADVARAIDAIGGYFNAWTSNDHTAYWNIVPHNHWQRGVEVPFELAFRPKLRPKDIERERGVIVEEIRMIQDNPASLVHDHIDKLLFAGHQLGRSIIGPEANILKMTHDDFTQYHQQHYLPSQSLFIAVGNVSSKDYQAAVKAYVESLPAKAVTKPALFTGRSKQALSLQKKPTDQTHFALGLAAPELASNHPDYYAADVMNTVLGRGMSSRLFLNIREKKGLAYSIRSSLSSLEDTGALTVYGGVNTKKIKLTLEAIEEELVRLVNEPITQVELEEAIEQNVGSFSLSSDEPLDIARWFGTGTLLLGEQSFEQAIEKTKAVTVADVSRVAKDLIKKEMLCLAVIGPYESDQIFQDFLSTIKI